MRRKARLEPSTGHSLSHNIAPSLPHGRSARQSYLHTESKQVFQLHLRKSQVSSIVFMFLLVTSCFSYPNPRIEAQKGRKPGAVYFRTDDCRPLSEEQLQKRMGPYYDSARMASNPEMLRLGQFSNRETDGYVGDDPDIYPDDVIYDEDDVDDEEEVEGVEMDEEDIYSESEETIESVFQVRNKFMRRKRSEPRILSKRGLNSDIGTLQLKLALSGRKNKGHRSQDRSRKQLKKQLREKIRKSNKEPPWQCEMRPEYKKMREGIFPRFVTDGRCVTDKCFFRIYNCVPKKYRIRLLERDPDRCNPLPLIGSNSTFEEKWYFRNYLVTVGCNCERRTQKKRRRH